MCAPIFPALATGLGIYAGVKTIQATKQAQKQAEAQTRAIEAQTKATAQIVAPAPQLQDYQDTTDVKDAQQDAKRKALLARGYQSTIATSGMGLATPANVQQKTLLGS